MSRAFVKEDSGDRPDDTPERRSSGLPNYVTPDGKAALRRRVSELEETFRELRKTRTGDPLHTQRLRAAERDLLYYEHRLKTAVLVDNSGCGAAEARFGALVSARDGDGTLYRFHIVGEDEADPDTGKISWASPLASALLGARTGAYISWEKKTGGTKLEIVSIDYPGADQK